jgi:hypothetical protein
VASIADSSRDIRVGQRKTASRITPEAVFFMP